MRDTLLIALFAFLGAVVAGLLGAVALRLLRHRSLVTSLTVVAAVAVTAMLAVFIITTALSLQRRTLRGEDASGRQAGARSPSA